MEKDSHGNVTETPQEARQGVNVRGMTTVLFLSIGLVVVAFGAIWYFVR